MRALAKPLLLITAALLLPIIPFLLLGDAFEERIAEPFRGELSGGARFALIVGVLATDVFLPVPSSVVSTYGGGVLGVLPAALASWLGMTAGALFGYGLARGLGRPFAARMAGETSLEETSAVWNRFGPLALVLTRPLPILAEACALLMGATRLPLLSFLVPVMAANAVISLIYAGFGAYAADRNALPFAILASAVLPLIVALFARRYARRWA